MIHVVGVPNGDWNLRGELTFPELDTWLQQRRLWEFLRVNGCSP